MRSMPATYQQRLQAHDFDAALVEYSLGGSADPDVYAFWHEGQYPDGKNYGGVATRASASCSKRRGKTRLASTACSYYQEFQREFVARAVALPLYYPLFTFATVAESAGRSVGLHRLARRPLPQHRRLVD